MYLLKVLNDCGESNDVLELKLQFQKLFDIGKNCSKFIRELKTGTGPDASKF